MSISERGSEKLEDGVKKNLIVYCVHAFPIRKIQLQKVGVEIFNSRQNRIQYEKRYERNAIFKN